MFRPIADARYCFQSAGQDARRPSSAKQTLYTPYGAVVLADGTTVELDYTLRSDEKKLSALAVDQVVGLGWRDRRTGGWSVTVRGDLNSKHEAKGATLADALRAALDARTTAEAAEVALRNDAPAHLERELRRHDWWHMMSDSYGAVSAGERHMREITAIAARLPVETVRALWAAHAPAEFACPV